MTLKIDMVDNEVVYGVIREMLEQRGYTVEEENDENTNLIIGEKDGEKIGAFKEIFTKFNVKEFTSCSGFLNGLELKHGIVVYNKITAAVKKLLESTTGDHQDLKCQIEPYCVTELSFNPTKHSLVPTHTRVPDDEAKLLKEKYEAAMFPIIKSTDPIVRFLAFKKGDIIKIVRKNGFVVYMVVR